MRVNIAYSVDLDEVPDLVKSLVQEVLEDFSLLESFLSEAIYSIEKEKQLNTQLKIDEARKKMAKMDARLSECAAMYDGYWGALQPPPALNKEENNESTEG